MLQGERVIVAGGSVHLRGPVPLPLKWDPPPPGEAEFVGESQQLQELSMPPVLCPGPWKWVLSPARSVTVMLQQGGDVKFLKTTLGTLTEQELQEIDELMSVLGDGAVDPNASWIRPDHFQLAKVSGSWEPARQRLSLKLEGADELGSASMSFISRGEPQREQGGVSIAGDVELGREQMRSALMGSLQI